MSSAEAEYVALSTSLPLQSLVTPYSTPVPSTSILALPKDRFKYLVRRIGMRRLTLAELEVLAKESA
uniref:Uncharacterized protein n=1 Tax=Tanacetum cinerariifolium TaxID=118510 RepID=A0A6L2MDK9_TANCI|nr:hypothetical protein [Tanacetum cinerariifolium]